MKRQTGNEYQGGEYAKALCVSEAKVGKSTFLVASCLGALPWQEFGGIVDKPENLHVISFDSDALAGINKFLKTACGVSEGMGKADILNMEDDFRQCSEGAADYNFKFYNAVMTALQQVQEATAKKGVHALIISSLTGMAAGFERSIFGAPGGSDRGANGGQRGFGADPAKWKLLSQQIHEVRNFAQMDKLHCFWEGHIDKPSGMGMKGEEQKKESIRVSGEAGRNFPYNCSQVFRIRRMFGQKHPDTKVEKTFLDTQPTLDFVSGGRGFSELAPQEPDMTAAFNKLGLEVGQYMPPKKK